ncbi:hypothetical protein [Colwellia maritima]|uniref:hypothetical protein n=1 Tax=Colwellia maritima TaxID=2912588 RepID=UPI003083EE33
MNTKTLLLFSSLAATTLIACQAEQHVSNKEQQSVSNEIETLINFNSKDALNQVKLVNASSNKMMNDQALTVYFDSKKHTHSAIVFTPKTPWDWSHYQDFNLAFDISNSGKHSVQLYLDITDIDGGNYTRSVNIPIGAANTYYAKMVVMI